MDEACALVALNDTVPHNLLRAGLRNVCGTNLLRNNNSLCGTVRMIIKVNLRDACAALDAAWTPKIAGELNGQYVKIAKFEGEYVWHKHDEEDELFLVVEGHVDIHLRDKTIGLDAGEFTIVPRGVEHKPSATCVASVVLFEPVSTRSTGDVDDERTIEPDELERA